MDIFASNLMGHTQRLIAREMELTGGQENRALASIARDFDKAAGWMQEHQQYVPFSSFPSGWFLAWKFQTLVAAGATESVKSRLIRRPLHLCLFFSTETSLSTGLRIGRSRR